MQDLPNGGGGRRSKHWPPGAGDPSLRHWFVGPTYTLVGKQMYCFSNPARVIRHFAYDPADTIAFEIPCRSPYHS